MDINEINGIEISHFSDDEIDTVIKSLSEIVQLRTTGRIRHKMEYFIEAINDLMKENHPIKIIDRDGNPLYLEKIKCIRDDKTGVNIPL